MSDIVRDLRKAAANGYRRELLESAASEIECLRADRDRLYHALFNMRRSHFEVMTLGKREDIIAECESALLDSSGAV